LSDFGAFGAGGGGFEGLASILMRARELRRGAGGERQAPSPAGLAALYAPAQPQMRPGQMVDAEVPGSRVNPRQMSPEARDAILARYYREGWGNVRGPTPFAREPAAIYHIGPEDYRTRHLLSARGMR
jgi:hypothetical protein